MLLSLLTYPCSANVTGESLKSTHSASYQNSDTSFAAMWRLSTVPHF